MIKVKKIVWAKIDLQNVVADPDQNQQNQYGNNKMISFGSLVIGFICLYPCVATYSLYLNYHRRSHRPNEPE